MTRTMKDSGIEWIGQIPEHWSSCNICYQLKKSGSGTTPQGEEYYDGDILWLNTGDLNDSYVDETKKTITNLAVHDYSVLKVYPVGSIVIAMYGATIGKMGILQKEMATNQACCVMLPSDNLYNKFLFYSLSAGKDFLISLSVGAGQPNINQANIRKFQIPYISLSEQQKIADYLDEKCGKIDETIENQKKVVEKLKEYKQSLITETVCKGLNSTAPMKDSGIEWIGQIPTHWEVKKLKYLCSLLRGKFNHRPRNDPDYYDGIYPFLQTGDVSQSQRYITQYSQTLNDLGYSVSKEFPKNSIIMTIAANVGDVAILTFNACIPDSLIGFYPLNNVNLNYLYFSFVAMKNNLLRKAIISTQLNLNIEIVKEEKLLFPHLSEQQQIADYLDSKCSEIDDLISKKEQIITKLAEYKKSLIFECVTGKKEIV